MDNPLTQTQASASVPEVSDAPLTSSEASTSVPDVQEAPSSSSQASTTVPEVPQAPPTSSQASISVPEVLEASSTPSQASAPVQEVSKASSTPRPRITHDDRIRITTLRSIGWTYQAIAAYVGCSQRQVQYTVQDLKPTPQKHAAGRFKAKTQRAMLGLKKD